MSIDYTSSTNSSFGGDGYSSSESSRENLSSPSSTRTYSRPTRKNDFLLISQSGQQFYFPRWILISQSTFFQDINCNSISSPGSSSDSLSSPSDDDRSSYTKVYLDKASTPGLRFALTILDFLLCGVGSIPPFHPRFVIDVIPLAKTYDLPIIPRLLYHLYSPRIHYAFELYTLAALADDEPGMKKAAKRALQNEDMETMPKWTIDLLNTYAPDHLESLAHKFSQKQSAYTAMREDLRSCLRKEKDFAEICKRHKCDTYKLYDGDWNRVVWSVCNVAWRQVKKANKNQATIVAEAALENGITCGKCNERIRPYYHGAISEYWEALP